MSSRKFTEGQLAYQAAHTFTLAPGVQCMWVRLAGHARIWGRREDLLACGIVDPDQLAELPKRALQFDVGGDYWHTTRCSGGRFEITIHQRSRGGEDPPLDSEGRRKVAWPQLLRDVIAISPPGENQPMSDAAVAITRAAYQAGILTRRQACNFSTIPHRFLPGDRGGEAAGAGGSK